MQKLAGRGLERAGGQELEIARVDHSVDLKGRSAPTRGLHEEVGSRMAGHLVADERNNSLFVGL